MSGRQNYAGGERGVFFFFSSYLAVEREHPVRASPDNLSIACTRANVIYLRDWAKCDSDKLLGRCGNLVMGCRNSF